MKKSKILLNLRRLRLEVEDGGALSEDQTYLLIDVCRALDLHDAETAYVVGDPFLGLLDRPIPYTLADLGDFGSPGRFPKSEKASARSTDLAPAAG